MGPSRKQRVNLKGAFAQMRCDSRDASMRLTEKLEPYIFQRIINAARSTQQCERIIEIYSVLVFPLIALTHRVCVKGLLLDMRWKVRQDIVQSVTELFYCNEITLIISRAVAFMDAKFNETRLYPSL